MKLNNVFDLSFWDNPRTRTGYPGVKAEKEKRDVDSGKYLDFFGI